MDKEEMVLLKKLLVHSTRGLDFYGVPKTAVVKMMHELTRLEGVESVIHLLRILNALASTKD